MARTAAATGADQLSLFERFDGCARRAELGDPTTPAIVLSHQSLRRGSSFWNPSANLLWDEFVEGFWGRPVDLEHLPDGSMLLSDDFADVIYRISYDG